MNQYKPDYIKPFRFNRAVKLGFYERDYVFKREYIKGMYPNAWPKKVSE